MLFQHATVYLEVVVFFMIQGVNSCFQCTDLFTRLVEHDVPGMPGSSQEERLKRARFSRDVAARQIAATAAGFAVAAAAHRLAVVASLLERGAREERGGRRRRHQAQHQEQQRNLHL